MPILGSLYALVTYTLALKVGWNLNEIINLLLAILLAYSLGRLTDSFVIRRCHIRRPLVAVSMSVLAALAAYYVH
ncbi:MAG: hypothetical protein ACI841_002658 [Planctomycetota bacterium]|jgi:hypothetical protein